MTDTNSSNNPKHTIHLTVTGTDEIEFARSFLLEIIKNPDLTSLSISAESDTKFTDAIAVNNTRDPDTDNGVGADTWKHRVLCVLNDSPGPKTSSDVKDLLEETAWDATRTHVSTTLRELFEDGYVERETQERSGPGKPPYAYWLSDTGDKICESLTSLLGASLENTDQRKK